jgi:hypothetical protein
VSRRESRSVLRIDESDRKLKVRWIRLRLLGTVVVSVYIPSPERLGPAPDMNGSVTEAMKAFARGAQCVLQMHVAAVTVRYPRQGGRSLRHDRFSVADRAEGYGREQEPQDDHESRHGASTRTSGQRIATIFGNSTAIVQKMSRL